MRYFLQENETNRKDCVKAISILVERNLSHHDLTPNEISWAVDIVRTRDINHPLLHFHERSPYWRQNNFANDN